MQSYAFSTLELLGALLGAMAIGVLARRRRAAQVILAWIGPVYAIGLLAFLLVEGTRSVCSGQGATFRCTEMTYASSWNTVERLVVAGMSLLSLAPLAALWLRTRVPSALASIIMPVVIAVYGIGLTVWTPAWIAVFAAAIAGTPERIEPDEPAQDIPV